MSGDVVNLRLARKRRDRAEKAAAAAANRLRFGESKVERAERKARSEKAERQLDAHKRDRAPSDDSR